MIRYYFDQNVPRAITEGLRLRGVDVITAFDDERSDKDDSELLDRSTELNRALFTQDNDLVAEAVKRQRKDTFFAGVIYAHQLRISIGACINDLELIAKTSEMADIFNTVQFLPL